MIAYTMVGTRDLQRARRFYDPLCAEMDLQVCWQDDASVGYGRADDLNFPRFYVGYPCDGNQASVGNGVMTAFQFAEPDKVDRLHRLALGCGGRDEGAPVTARATARASMRPMSGTRTATSWPSWSIRAGSAVIRRVRRAHRPMPRATCVGCAARTNETASFSVRRA